MPLRTHCVKYNLCSGFSITQAGAKCKGSREILYRLNVRRRATMRGGGLGQSFFNASTAGASAGAHSAASSAESGIQTSASCSVL